MFRIHVSGIFILATILDAWAIFTLARETICLLPAWVPLVDLDLRASAGYLQVSCQEDSPLNCRYSTNIEVPLLNTEEDVLKAAQLHVSRRRLASSR